jgi:PAS domain S-box-containing protein
MTITTCDELTALLSGNPTAWVGAMGPDALLFTELPAGAPFDGHRRLQGRWVLDHTVSADRPTLGRAWRESRVLGQASVSVVVAGGGRATFHYFDRMAEHGCFVVVAIEEDGAVFATADFESHALQPRHCRVLRAESGRIFEVDDDAELVLGWRPDELIAEMPISLFHPDDHERIIDCWMATLADTKNGQRCRARFLRPDGTWMWLELTNHNRLDDADAPRVECEMLDVSDEMAAHEAVRAREQLLHRLAEALPIGVLQVDRDRRVVYSNDHLGVVLGFDAAMTADEVFAGVDGDDRPVVLAAIVAGLEDGADHDVAIRVHVGDAERVVRVITKALVAESGDASGVIVSVTDITDETNASREL